MPEKRPTTGIAITDSPLATGGSRLTSRNQINCANPKTRKAL